MKNLLITALAIIALSLGSLSAYIDEKDQRLNSHLKDFTPVYTTNKRVSWSFWSGEYEFSLSLLHNVKTDPTPKSDVDHMFLGYRDPNTKVKIMCYKMDPTYDHVLESHQVAVRKITDLDEVIPFSIPGLEHSNNVNLYLKIHRDMLDIKVKDSGKWWGLFKTYSPSRVFNVDLAVHHQPQSHNAPHS